MDIKNDNIAGLSKGDILSIIKACDKHNVESLKIDGLEIGFKSKQADQLAKWPEITASSVKRENDSPESEPSIERELDMLMINDPEAYEQAVFEGAMNGKATQD